MLSVVTLQIGNANTICLILYQAGNQFLERFLLIKIFLNSYIFFVNILFAVPGLGPTSKSTLKNF
jgi:hypothetical protein